MRRYGVAAILAAVVVTATMIGQASSTAAGVPEFDGMPVGPAASYTVTPPPPGFDPLTASNAELARYGFPERPASGSARYQVWADEVSHAKHFVVPKAVSLLGSYAGTTGTQDLCNWSGYSDYPPSSYYFNGASMEWYVPSVGSSTEASRSSIWPGIGSNDIIQAGSEEDYNGSTANYYLWYELYPQESQQPITNFPISPGDEIFSYVNYDPGVNDAHFYLEDYTTGLYTSLSQPLTQPFDGGSSEFIVERTAGSGGPQPLADFLSADIFNAQAEDSAGPGYQPYSYWNNTVDQMIWNGVNYAEVTSSASTSFNVTWDNYGTAGC